MFVFDFSPDSQMPPWHTIYPEPNTNKSDGAVACSPPVSYRQLHSRLPVLPTSNKRTQKGRKISFSYCHKVVTQIPLPKQPWLSWVLTYISTVGAEWTLGPKGVECIKQTHKSFVTMLLWKETFQLCALLSMECMHWSYSCRYVNRIAKRIGQTLER